MTSDARHRLQIMAAFAVVYLVWGSTYLAIRIGVRNVMAGLVIMGIACMRELSLPRR